MKLVKLAVVALLTVVTSTAQNADKAKKLLDEVTTKAKSYKNITIDFSYSLQNIKENIKQDSKGKVVMQGNMYNLNFMNVTKIFDGKKIYTISPDDEEITISKLEDSDEKAVTPNKLLSFFQTGYKYSWDIQQKIKGKTIQLIKLIPTDAKSTQKELLVGIDTKTKQLYNVLEIGKNGTRTTLTVLSYKTNQKISATTFVFNKAKYPNYFINNID